MGVCVSYMPVPGRRQMGFGGARDGTSSFIQSSSTSILLWAVESRELPVEKNCSISCLAPGRRWVQFESCIARLHFARCTPIKHKGCEGNQLESFQKYQVALAFMLASFFSKSRVVVAAVCFFAKCA